jgi:hypothetical protein
MLPPSKILLQSQHDHGHGGETSGHSVGVDNWGGGDGSHHVGVAGSCRRSVVSLRDLSGGFNEHVGLTALRAGSGGCGTVDRADHATGSGGRGGRDVGLLGGRDIGLLGSRDLGLTGRDRARGNMARASRQGGVRRHR